MTDEPRTPLTLEFQPDNIDDGTEGMEDFTPIVICEPSFQASGRIFVGVNPVGKRLGVHLLPDDARRVRDHLSKLLMEPTPEAAPEPGAETPEERIARAFTRHQTRTDDPPVRRKRRKRAPFKREFRIEFQIGRVQGVLGSLPK